MWEVERADNAAATLIDTHSGRAFTVRFNPRSSFAWMRCRAASWDEGGYVAPERFALTLVF